MEIINKKTSNMSFDHSPENNNSQIKISPSMQSNVNTQTRLKIHPGKLARIKMKVKKIN